MRGIIREAEKPARKLLKELRREMIGVSWEVERCDGLILNNKKVKGTG